MKRARMMLMAIAVLAVVGGILAFRAQQAGVPRTFYGCTTSLVAGQQVTGCFFPFTTAWCTAQARITVPYSSTTTIMNCQPSTVLTSCGTAGVTICM